MGGVKEKFQRAQLGLLSWATAMNFEWLKRSKVIQGKGQRQDGSSPPRLSWSGSGWDKALQSWGGGEEGRSFAGGDGIPLQAEGIGFRVEARGLIQAGRREVASPKKGRGKLLIPSGGEGNSDTGWFSPPSSHPVPLHTHKAHTYNPAPSLPAQSSSGCLVWACKHDC